MGDERKQNQGSEQGGPQVTQHAPGRKPARHLVNPSNDPDLQLNRQQGDQKRDDRENSGEIVIPEIKRKE